MWRLLLSSTTVVQQAVNLSVTGSNPVGAADMIRKIMCFLGFHTRDLVLGYDVDGYPPLVLTHTCYWCGRKFEEYL